MNKTLTHDFRASRIFGKMSVYFRAVLTADKGSRGSMDIANLNMAMRIENRALMRGRYI